jgi:hypothetical protein
MVLKKGLFRNFGAGAPTKSDLDLNSVKTFLDVYALGCLSIGICPRPFTSSAPEPRHARSGAN